MSAAPAAARNAVFGFYYQIAHKGHNPKSVEPGIRLLRPIRNGANEAKADAMLTEKMKNEGNFFFSKTGRTGSADVPLCCTIERQQDTAVTTEVADRRIDECLAEHAHQEKMFHKNHELKMANKIEEAKRLYHEYIEMWNTYPWVRLMRKINGISDKGLIVPGSQPTLEADTEVPDLDLETNMVGNLPEGVVSDQHKYAVISVCMDNFTDDIEPVISVHGFFATEEDAIKAAENPAFHLKFKPFDPEVVTVGEWVWPLRMAWHDNAAQQKWAGDDRLSVIQNKRKNDLEQMMGYETLANQEKELDESVAKQMAEALKMDVDEIRRVCDHTQGVEDLVQASRIMDKGCREDAVDAIREKYLFVEPPPESGIVPLEEV